MIVFLSIIGSILAIVAFYVIVKDGVKNGILEAYNEIENKKVEKK
ncbi:DUF6019 family protein [Sedimentibacter sp. zth1]|nr:DUF6019 family protein [Sedimentibacter sp. zth1]